MNKLIFSAILLFSFVSSARDRIGNGGGFWACEYATGISKLHLVDLFEAQVEFQWNLISVDKNSDYQKIIERTRKRVSEDFPKYSLKWSKAVDHVLFYMKLIEAELKLIDDGLFRAGPLSSNCPQGQWNYLQVANFYSPTHIIVRKDIWDHQQMTELNKAALIWHEAIYYWLRQNYQDKKSPRARYITGLIFSDKTKEEKQKLLAEQLDQSLPPETPPPTLKDKWICTNTNNHENKYYAGLGPTKLKAQFKADKDCAEKSQDNLFCSRELCEEIKSDQLSWSCRTHHNLSEQIYLGDGRNKLEAHFNAIKQCLDVEFDDFHCVTRTQCEKS